MKILVIRFSSIGDLTQAMSLPAFIKGHHPDAEIHFVTRRDFASLLSPNPALTKVWSVDKAMGLQGLFELIAKLRAQKFTHIYDAHNNLRSFLIRALIWKPKKLKRPMMRLKRFLLLRFHINLFEQPFSGQRDLIKPLEQWGMKYSLPAAPQLFIDTSIRAAARDLVKRYDLDEYFVLVPSAAYELKRWPITHWKKLIALNPNRKFLILAGPSDDFTTALNSYSNVTNLFGQTDLLLSAALIETAKAVVSNDTGLLHMAEQLGRPAIALMGPAPFGFPSRSSTLVLERNLKCRPCSKHGQGPCINVSFQECLVSITAEEVSKRLDQITK